MGAKTYIVWYKTSDGRPSTEEVTSAMPKIQIEVMYRNQGFTNIRIVEGSRRRPPKGVGYIDKEYGLA